MIIGNEYARKKYKWDIIACFVILIFFLIICIHQLAVAGELGGDEFYSLRDTLGFAYTGQFYEWDFEKGQISDHICPFKIDFAILGIWIRIFGENAVALRGLTVCYSVLTIISFYYICKKWTSSLEWTIIASMFLAVNSSFVMMSTNVRGYGLMMLLMIWVFYLTYQMLNHKKNVIQQNKTQDIRQRYFNTIGYYAAATFILLLIAFNIRVFVMLYMVGIATYILCKGIWKKNKKFCILGSVFWGTIVGIFLGAGTHLDRYLPFLRGVCERLRKYALLGVRNREYLVDIGNIFYFVPVTMLGIGMLLYLLIFRKEEIEERLKDILLYCSSIVVTTLFLFLFVVDWAHNDIYMIAIYPFTILIISGGFYLYSRRKKGIFRGFFYGILFCCLLAEAKDILITKKENGKFQEAYTELAAYLKDAPTLITGQFLRHYYAKGILSDYVWRPMTSKEDVPDTDNLAELSEIGREYPVGIITCDDEKWYHFRNSFWQLLNMDAFERITGSGVDETGVSNWAYYICHRVEREEINLDESDTVLFGYNFGGAVQIQENENKTVIELQLNGNVSERTLLCLKVNQYHTDGKAQRYVQLVLEPNDSPTQYYRIELDNEEFVPNKSELDDHYYIYTSNKEPEEFEDCYIM